VERIVSPLSFHRSADGNPAAMAIIPAQDDPAYIEAVKQRTDELRSRLRDFGDRLDTMRERNAETAAEIEAFRADLDELHDWLVERL
jgi:hypothetical protein